jgi:hypothetical protein
MIPGSDRKDLIILVADRSMKLSMDILLARHKDLGIRSISCDVFSHENNDPGVLRESHSFLRAQGRRYRYAITICDRDGCGKEAFPREQLEASIEQRLRENGWENRAAAIVIDPELEAWIWGDWTVLARSIRWTGSGARLKDFLIQQRLLRLDQNKPPRPKEALESAMKHVQIRFSSAVHKAMAEQAEFAQCVDPAFLKMRATLQQWFPSR